LIRARNLIASLTAVAFLAGCTAFSAVPPAKKQEIGSVFRVEPSTLWSAAKDGNTQTWTINGFGLESISFITNVADGKAIAPKIQGKDAPTFRADMNATDVVDLYEAVLASRGFSQVEVRELRPHSISGLDAFRFDYSGFNGNGLAKRGMVIGLVDAKKGLNLVVYEAAAEHYYGASLAAAENVFNSLEKI
jgi:hypothetical protein